MTKSRKTAGFPLNKFGEKLDISRERIESIIHEIWTCEALREVDP